MLSYSVLFTTLLVLAFYINLVECRRVKRVIGGKEVSCGTHKHITSIRNATSSKHICGATILNPNSAITAAHCVEHAPKNYILYLSNYCASDDETKPFAVIHDIIINPMYDKYSRAHDIAILRLQLNVDDITWLRDRILPNSSFGISGECTIFGYGLKKLYEEETPDELTAANLSLISLDDCTRLLGPYVAPEPDSGMICAMGENVDACQGDSGGPLICGGKIEGVCGYGLSCGVPGLPGVYASIGAHLQWIKTVINDFEPFSRCE